MTITVRTPSPCSSVTSAAESVRGGSLSAISPINFIAFGDPAATASTLKPFPSSSFDAAVASGDGGARPVTAAKAPFTTRCVPRVGSRTVASDIFVAGSNGTNAVIFGASATALSAAAAQIAPPPGPVHPPNSPAQPVPEHAPRQNREGMDGRDRQGILGERTGFVGA